MRAYFFSDMAYPYVSESVVDEVRSARVVVPSSHCDPVVVAALYDQYLEEFEYAAELLGRLVYDGDLREAVVAGITNALWLYIERLKTRRKQLLTEMFKSAESVLERVVAKSEK